MFSFFIKGYLSYCILCFVVTHSIVVVVVVVVEKESDRVIVGPDRALWVYHWVVKLDQLCIIKY